jgi:hypothetical protein
MSLGYPRTDLPGENDDDGWRCHDSATSLDKKALRRMYIKGWANSGKTNDLFPAWDIMLQIFRETVNPKGTNFDEIHLYEVDLLYNAWKMQGKGIKMDVMDYIYNEMWSFTMEKKVPACICTLHYEAH